MSRLIPPSVANAAALWRRQAPSPITGFPFLYPGSQGDYLDVVRLNAPGDFTVQATFAAVLGGTVTHYGIYVHVLDGVTDRYANCAWTTDGVGGNYWSLYTMAGLSTYTAKAFPGVGVNQLVKLQRIGTTWYATLGSTTISANLGSAYSGPVYISSAVDALERTVTFHGRFAGANTDAITDAIGTQP